MDSGKSRGSPKFTPIFDTVAGDVGTVCAAVYGLVWRYCQLKNKVCSASWETLAKKIHVCTKTIGRHLKALVKAGYIVDLSPDRRYETHHYVCTNKINGKASTFTPIFETVAEDVGLESAAVYGQVWRRCREKGQQGKCRKSRKELAGPINVSVRTVDRHLIALVEAGYIEDETPGLRRQKHTYVCTDKAIAATAVNRSAFLGYGQKVPPLWSESPITMVRESNDVVVRESDKDTALDTVQDRTKTWGAFAPVCSSQSTEQRTENTAATTSPSETASAWGEHSAAFQQALALPRRSGKAADFQALGEMLDREFGLHPMWHVASSVSGWCKGLEELGWAAEWNHRIVKTAYRRMTHDGLVISSPFSLVKVTHALTAERRVREQRSVPADDITREEADALAGAFLNSFKR